jgi:spore maturation protein CgeB
MGSSKNLDKLLYVAMRYDYGHKERGLSFEYTNFFRVLERMIPTVVEFDFMTLYKEHGKEQMNRLLLETAEREAPDLIFFVLFTDELTKETLSALSRRWTTFNWFCDDHWRFATFSRHYAPCFGFVSTTDIHAVEKYRRAGYPHALQTQWACNHFDYLRLRGGSRNRDVTFVGQPHGNRRRVVNYLQRRGVAVETYGQGWPSGRVSQEEMIRLFNASKVNLNLSNSSWNIHTLFRGRQQIKGRNFEIPGCGGFLMTNYADGLERYFRLGEEVVCFTNKRDLLEKINYYCTHDDEREEIARKGYERTLAEHTYQRRFNALFDAMGFSR